MTASAAHLRTSTLISIVISMAISAAFFLLVFGLAVNVPVFGTSGLALDFVPQTLAAGFMAALMPCLQTRAKIIAGDLPGTPLSPLAIARRALLLAVAALGLAAIVTAGLWLAGTTTLPWTAALALKIGYGGLIGLIVTPVALHALLSKG